VLKLIYHTAALGPIELEYSRPVIRVGSSGNNDLVLAHPSVEPHHCQLVFREEKLLCIPASPAIPPEMDLRSLRGPEYGAGEQLRIGEVLFSLAHSARSVAVPTPPRPGLERETVKTHPPNAVEKTADSGSYYCPQCQEYYQSAEVRRVGLVGSAKRCLCPKCSRVLDIEPVPRKAAPARRK
jgi:FHA domain